MENKKYDPIKHLEEKVKELHDNSGERNKSILKKYPIAFSLLITFGVVSVLHGFELVVGQIDFLRNNPWLLIFLGLIILTLTGSVYKTFENRK